jgi:hypothetical protein
MGHLEAAVITDMNRGSAPQAQSPCSGAEARGFEPRMGVNPNRISSPFSTAKAYVRRPRLAQSAQVSGVTSYKPPEPGTAWRNLRCANSVPLQPLL